MKKKLMLFLAALLMAAVSQAAVSSLANALVTVNDSTGLMDPLPTTSGGGAYTGASITAAVPLTITGDVSYNTGFGNDAAVGPRVMSGLFVRDATDSNWQNVYQGQQTMDQSLGVAIASNQTAVPVKLSGTAIQMKSIEYIVVVTPGSVSDTLILAGTPGVKYVVTSVEVSCSIDRFVRVKYATGVPGNVTLAGGHMAANGGFEKPFPVPYKCTTGNGIYVDQSGGGAGNLMVIVHYYEE